MSEDIPRAQENSVRGLIPEAFRSLELLRLIQFVLIVNLINAQGYETVTIEMHNGAYRNEIGVLGLHIIESV